MRTVLRRAMPADVSTSDRTVTATVSTDALDGFGSVILPKGIDLKRYRNNPVVLWCHDLSAPPVAVCRSIGLGDDKRSIVAALRFSETGFGAELFDLYRQDILKAFSVGLDPVPGGAPNGPPTAAEIRSRPELGGASMVWRSTVMVELSACPVGANPEALATAVTRGYHPTAAILRAMIAPPADEAEALPRLGRGRTYQSAKADVARSIADEARARLDLLRGRV